MVALCALRMPYLSVDNTQEGGKISRGKASQRLIRTSTQRMIETIQWKLGHNELPSPFMRGKDERPLRITLHSESLDDVSEDEKEAVELLRELGNLPELEVFDTGAGDSPQIVIGACPRDDVIPVQLVHRGVTKVHTGIWHRPEWSVAATDLLDPTERSESSISDMRNLLILAQAHRQVGGDVLVTCSPLLLRRRDKSPIRETTPRTPIEAGQLVGLFLRSRDIYTCKAGANSKISFGSHLFYLVLARYRLPSMWRYFSACVASSKARGDDIQALGEAILTRAVRALEARDAIGIQFYVPQSNSTRDRMMYHFDYLTLVLAGAIDAQARVAHRVYHLPLEERYASFRHEGFRNSLKEKAAELYELASGGRFQDLLTLLYEPRNTIHGAILQTLGYKEASKPQHSFVSVPQPTSCRLWKAAEKLGGAEAWGLTSRSKGVWLEPYSYASALVRETLHIIDAVAAATDVSRLFQVGQPVPSLMEEAPEDSEFAWGKGLSLMA